MILREKAQKWNCCITWSFYVYFSLEALLGTFHHSTFPPAVLKGSSFSMSSPTLSCFLVFDSSSPDGVKCYLAVLLICAPWMIRDVEHLVGLCWLSVSFGERSVQALCPLFELGYCCVEDNSSLHFLSINPISDVWFAILSHPVDSLFLSVDGWLLRHNGIHHTLWWL